MHLPPVRTHSPPLTADIVTRATAAGAAAALYLQSDDSVEMASVPATPMTLSSRAQANMQLLMRQELARLEERQREEREAWERQRQSERDLWEGRVREQEERLQAALLQMQA